MSKKKEITKEDWKASVADDMRYEHTDYVVDDVDYHGLWEKYHYNYGIAPWEQDSMGSMRTIGYIDDRPICVTVYWYIVGDFRVAVVEGTSQLVDHAMIEAWEKAVFPCMADRYNRHSNGDNFHNLLHDMERRQGKKFPMRDYNAVRDAIERIPAK